MADNAGAYLCLPKGDLTIWANYRGRFAYKVLLVYGERSKPTVNELIGLCQFGFTTGRFPIDPNHLFADFKAPSSILEPA